MDVVCPSRRSMTGRDSAGCSQKTKEMGEESWSTDCFSRPSVPFLVKPAEVILREKTRGLGFLPSGNHLHGNGLPEGIPLPLLVQSVKVPSDLPSSVQKCKTRNYVSPVSKVIRRIQYCIKVETYNLVNHLNL